VILDNETNYCPESSNYKKKLNNIDCYLIQQSIEKPHGGISMNTIVVFPTPPKIILPNLSTSTAIQQK
jgi:hypothetical protein